MKKKTVEKNDDADLNGTINEYASPVCYQNDPEIQPDYQLPSPASSKSTENKPKVNQDQDLE